MIEIGNYKYSTKKEAKDFLRSKLKKYINDENTKIHKNDNDYDFIYKIYNLENQDNKHTKIIKYFEVGRNPLNKVTHHVTVRYKNDMNKYPVGLVKYIDNIGKRKHNNNLEGLAESLRKVINYQIKNFRQKNKMICELCKEDNKIMHVDHIIKFRDLKNNFLKNNYDIPEIINDEIVGGKKFINETDDFIIRWQKYHKENSKLRMLCCTCNFKLR